MPNAKKKSKSSPVRKSASKPATRAAGAAHTVEAKPTPAARVITAQVIAEAAYFLWLERGGDQVSNWVDAERKLRSEAALAK